MDLRRLYAVLLDGRSWRLVGWQLLSFPGDLFWGVLVWVLYSVGAGLVVVWVGILVLVGAQVLMRSVAALEVRTLAAVVGDPPLPIAPRRPSSQPGLRGTVLARLADATAWRCALWNASRLVLGPLAFTTALAAVVSPVAVVGGLVVAIVALSDGWYGPGQSLDGLLVVVWSALLVVAGVPGLWWLTRGVAWLQVALVRWAVSPSARSQLAAQEQRAERAEERVRIDQELHDSIGHMITMNTVQAGAGAYVFDTDPEFARQALRTIEERGRAAMGELDR
ncbi:MAG TPA: sensor domain-containing protein, partial [Actinotalea sp.]|nr:sensor domain-containing protein [Actinotalea sp.]